MSCPDSFLAKSHSNKVDGIYFKAGLLHRRRTDLATWTDRLAAMPLRFQPGDAFGCCNAFDMIWTQGIIIGLLSLGWTLISSLTATSAVTTVPDSMASVQLLDVPC